MSLLNANDGNKNVRTIYITKVYRNSKTESFGDSVMNDFASAMLPAAQITSSIYRKKAIKALERRNSIMGYESDYLYNLCRYSAGNGISAWGLAAEANFYDYIVKYCNMEVKAFETAEKYGGLSPKLMDLLANPPHPSVGHFRKVFYTIKVDILCMLEGFKKRKEMNAEAEAFEDADAIGNMEDDSNM